MTYAEHYRAKAEKCERDAQTAHTDDRRLLEMLALEWRDIAGKLEPRPTPSQPANG